MESKTKITYTDRLLAAVSFAPVLLAWMLQLICLAGSAGLIVKLLFNGSDPLALLVQAAGLLLIAAGSSMYTTIGTTGAKYPQTGASRGGGGRDK